MKFTPNQFAALSSTWKDVQVLNCPKCGGLLICCTNTAVDNLYYAYCPLPECGFEFEYCSTNGITQSAVDAYYQKCVNTGKGKLRLGSLEVGDTFTFNPSDSKDDIYMVVDFKPEILESYIVGHQTPDLDKFRFVLNLSDYSLKYVSVITSVERKKFIPGFGFMR